MPPTLCIVTFKSHLAQFAAEHLGSFLMLNSDTRAMGCFVDVLWCDLNMKADGHSQPYQRLFAGHLNSRGLTIIAYLYVTHRINAEIRRNLRVSKKCAKTTRTIMTLRYVDVFPEANYKR